MLKDLSSSLSCLETHLASRNVYASVNPVAVHGVLYVEGFFRSSTFLRELVLRVVAGMSLHEDDLKHSRRFNQVSHIPVPLRGWLCGENRDKAQDIRIPKPLPTQKA